LRVTDVPKEIFERLSPYNWDFRIIPEWLLQHTIKFEYLRSWKELHEAALNWLEKQIKGKTVREYLIESQTSDGLHSMPAEVSDAIPPEWYFHFFDFLENPVYPTPTTWMMEQGRHKKRMFTDWEKKILAGRMVDVRPMTKEYADYVLKKLSNANAGPSYGYFVKINFENHRNEDLVKAFAFWLRDEAKRSRKIKVHGRASSVKWHRLRQIAAKRLSDSGLNSKDTQRLIAAREKAVPLPKDFNKVLPKYNSPGAWHDAIQEANQFVETMKRSFHYENWEVL
jgi:hypothetical protein